VKTLLAAVVVLALGAGIGAGVTWWEFHSTEDWFTSDGRPLVVEGAADPYANAPKVVVVGGEKFDFGVQERHTTRSHTFVIKNEGAAPLVLTMGKTTCSCTLSEASNTTIDPGQQMDVKLTWETKLEGDAFRQHAEVRTNDPRRDLIRLAIFGRVIDPLAVKPDRLTFTNHSASDSREALVKVFSTRDANLTLGEPEFSNPANAGHFEVSSRALSTEELAQQPDAKSGYEVTVIAKSGLPLGPINQTIQIPTNMDGKKASIAVEGTVVGDIRLTMVGKNLLVPDQNRLLLGAVNQQQGAVVSMKILVSGPHREKINLRIGKVDPADVLQATIGELTRGSTGKIDMYDLKIEVPKNSPLTNRSGTAGAPAGTITIESDHPDTPRLTLSVEFAIEG
jgi:hypothetical protein